MNKFKHIIFLLIFLPLLANGQEISTDNLQQTVKYLASDELEGRLPGTDGCVKAAEYIRSKYQEYGLKPLGNNYFQEMQLTTGLEPTDECNAYFKVVVPKPGIPKDRLRPVTRKWDIEKDWMPMNFSESGEVSGELVFAGYGMTVPDMQYDDYKDIDVDGKIVIVLTGSPKFDQNENNNNIHNTSYRFKASKAKQLGAKAIIFVKEQGDSANVFEPLDYSALDANSGIIAIQANRTSIAKFFPRNKSLYPLEKKINLRLMAQSFLLPNVEAFFNVGLNKIEKPSQNVIGYIEGTDSDFENKYIFIGGHYDHLGYGGPTSMYNGDKAQIHNGADDNASGIAAMLELARYFSENPLPRPIAFCAFTGEEMGLLGSNYYSDNQIIPFEKVDVMFNYDMIGRLRDNNLRLFGTGTSSKFTPALAHLAMADSIKITELKEGFGASDHTNFFKNGVPVLHFFTGVHEDYHHPNDDWDKVNYEGLAKIVDYSIDVIKYFGEMEESPDYNKTNMKSPEKSGRSHGSSKVWFGIVPNFEENPDGFKISGTSAGSPAQKAGLQSDDVITKLNDIKIDNIHDFTNALRQFKPGEELKVKVIRDGKEMDFTVKLVGKQ